MASFNYICNAIYRLLALLNKNNIAKITSIYLKPSPSDTIFLSSARRPYTPNAIYFILISQNCLYFSDSINFLIDFANKSIFKAIFKPSAILRR